MAACTNKNSANSEIASWYNGRSVLITGGTGFMGKVLVEKLLRSCPGLKTIYLLIRPKKGQDPKQRISQLVELPVCFFINIFIKNLFFNLLNFFSLAFRQFT